jgi:hypothetical protein
MITTVHDVRKLTNLFSQVFNDTFNIENALRRELEWCMNDDN